MNTLAPRSFTLPQPAPPQTRGLQFLRFVKALGLAGGDCLEAEAVAVDRWGPTSMPAIFCRAAVTAGTTAPGSWGVMASYTSAADEFFDLVRSASVVGRMTSLHRVPVNARAISLVEGATGYWVGEAEPKPASQQKYVDESLPAKKAVALLIVTAEILKLSDSGTEQQLKADLVAVVTDLIDSTFLDPGNAGDDATPASITNGIVPIASTGDLDADLKALFAGFQGDLSTSYMIASPAIGAGLTSPSRPLAGAQGGSVAGVDLLTSKNAPAGSIVLADGAGIALADGTMRADASRHGDVEMVDAPTGVASFGLWQANCVGLLVEKAINWASVRTGAVAVLTGL